jgi:hypothetical protein
MNTIRNFLEVCRDNNSKFLQVIQQVQREMHRP